MFEFAFFEGTTRLCFLKFGGVYLEFGTYCADICPGIVFFCTKYATGFQFGSSFWGLTYNQ